MFFFSIYPRPCEFLEKTSRKEKNLWSPFQSLPAGRAEFKGSIVGLKSGSQQAGMMCCGCG